MVMVMCALCGDIFEGGQSQEDAIAELHRVFGQYGIDECELVCDDCYYELCAFFAEAGKCNE